MGKKKYENAEVKIQEYNLADIETTIRNKINDFTDKYHQYPRYLKIPLFVSYQLKRNIDYISPLKIDYYSERLEYRKLIICETIAITQLKEIEVF